MNHAHMCIPAEAWLPLGGCVLLGTDEEVRAKKNQEIVPLETERATL